MHSLPSAVFPSTPQLRLPPARSAAFLRITGGASARSSRVSEDCRGRISSISRVSEDCRGRICRGLVFLEASCLLRDPRALGTHIIEPCSEGEHLHRAILKEKVYVHVFCRDSRQAFTRLYHVFQE
ncbi:hypothetical protein O6H91_07G041200 [Diphasiastrum complanatum]|uniref:Uncharacterized protein n=1 Tax=Diphasiastrum complanatum TaxID=34168 RepID=A0ACC2D4H4_DIPCM|nr:hypothetical protein O6H91_Y478700 [Diphasiastrum complanatum]KAJ7549123.1 hypothetical protein O6H91_07G041200 [Diphasiastrum complanatum]